AVDGAPLEVEQLIEAGYATARHTLEEDGEDLRRDARVGERAVAAGTADAERPGHGVERAAAQLGHEPMRELERAERGQMERPAADQALRRVQMPHGAGPSPVVSRSTATNDTSWSGRASASWMRARQRPSPASKRKRGSAPRSVARKRAPNSGSRPCAVKTSSSSSSGVAPAGRS